MKVYFYHTQDLGRIERAWKAKQFPGHFLYGATHLPNHGIDVVMHKHKDIQSRARLMLYVTWRVLTCRQHIDAIYATHWDGLELIIFMRALHLYPHPVILWHHQPIVKADSSMREMMAHIFYRGIDQMFFFSEALLQQSLLSSKAREERMHVVHWGADLEYYDNLMKQQDVGEHTGFISTGKEKRDMPTLIRAFSATGHPLNIFIAYKACGDNYLEILGDLRPSANIHIQFIKGLIPHELAAKVWAAKYVAICCQETNYTVGLTTLVEALALGMPVIATRNKTYPIDIEREGVGIVVPYYDSVAWEKAIRYITSDTDAADEMGRKARRLAEQLYNLETCTAEVAEVIKQYEKQPKHHTKAHAAAAEPAKTEDITPSPTVPTAKAADITTPVETPKVADITIPFEAPEAEEKPLPATKAKAEPASQPSHEEEWRHEETSEGQRGTAAHQSLSNQPIVNIEALKYRLRNISDTLRPLLSGAKSLFSHIHDYVQTKAPVIRKGCVRLMAQIKTYLPTREEMADLWEKIRQLAGRLVKKLKSMKR